MVQQQNQWMIFVFVAFALLIVVSLVSLYSSDRSIVGEAFYSTDDTTTPTGTAVWLKSSKGTAAAGDQVPVSIMFTTDPSKDKVTTLAFKISYDKNVFTVTKAPDVDINVYSLDGSPSQTITDLNSGKEVSILSTSGGVGGSERQLATLYFEVNKFADETKFIDKEFPIKVELITFDSDLGGTHDILSKLPTLQTDVKIVPFCVDKDGDGFSIQKDKRACKGNSKSTFDARVVADCDDNNGKKFPGNVETCDGLDNNCDGVKDSPLQPVLNDPPPGAPDKLEGICLNYKVCKDSGTAKAKLVNSYEEINGFVYDKDKSKDELHICDGYDSDCDGIIDEKCSSKDNNVGKKGTAGNLLYNWKDGKYSDTQKIDSNDLYGLFVIKDTYVAGYNGKDLKCVVRDAGYLCYCKNGDYYLPKSDKSSWFFVDYDQQTRKNIGKYAIKKESGDLILYDENSQKVACST